VIRSHQYLHSKSVAASAGRFGRVSEADKKRRITATNDDCFDLMQIQIDWDVFSGRALFPEVAELISFIKVLNRKDYRVRRDGTRLWAR